MNRNNPDVPNRSRSGYEITPLSEEERAKRAAALSPEERRVILHQGTEPPFCGGLLAHKEPGVYVCRLCELPLFRSAAKFESGTGWPSFYQPIEGERVATEEDRSLFMRRTEVHCARCGGHLGHLFDDGPQPTGQRYCINSASLELDREGQ